MAKFTSTVRVEVVLTIESTREIPESDLIKLGNALQQECSRPEIRRAVVWGSDVMILDHLTDWNLNATFDDHDTNIDEYLEET